MIDNIRRHIFPTDTHDIVMIVRTLIECMVFILFVILPHKINFISGMPQLKNLQYGVTAALISSTIFLLLTVNQRINQRSIKNITYLESLADAVLIIWLIWIFGGMNGPFFFFYFLAVMEAAFTLNPVIVILTVWLGIFFTTGEYIYSVSVLKDHFDIYNLITVFFRVLSLSLIGYYSFSFLKSLVKEKKSSQELEEAYRRLEEASLQIKSIDKIKSDLLNMASHEFRTPLSAIKNAVWLLNKDEVMDKLNTKEQTNIHRLVKSTDRLMALQDNLKQMLQTSAGQLSLELDAVQVEQIISDVYENKTLEAKNKRVNLDMQLDNEILPSILADANKIKYVLWELITNSLKYTSSGDSITLSAKRRGEQLEIKVMDTGSGIPNELASKLFSSFGKIDYFHTSQPGFGLGLYIVKKIIDLHNGEINIDSRKGHGTTVTLLLPINKYDPQVNLKV